MWINGSPRGLSVWREELKDDDDGGGAQKTKEGKERRNYDGIKIIKKFLKE